MPARMIDLRSDTVTHPSPEMRQAMAGAEVGDDGRGEDPTVNRLEELTAERLGKEAAVLLLSGTMGNLVGVLAQTERDDTVIVGDDCHGSLSPSAGVVVYGGVQLHQVPTLRGRMDLRDVASAIQSHRDAGESPSTLLCLENTHNSQGGAALTVEATRAVANLAHEHGLRVHLDGARLFNAAVALDIPAHDLVADVDSVTFCLSKGLSCPVGSLLSGSADYIQRAREVRKLVGGALRQSGVIAAAGIVALEQMIDRLAEDHANAKRLAEGLANIPGLSIDPAEVATNLVFVDVDTDYLNVESLGQRLGAEGVQVNVGARTRFVTHYGISDDDIDYTLLAVERATAAARTPAGVSR